MRRPHSSGSSPARTRGLAGLNVCPAASGRTADVYAAIAQRAPNAKIIVLGYPRLFAAPTNDCDVPASAATFLNSMGDQLNQSISGAVAAEAVSGVNIHFINPDSPGDGTSGFTGHELCAAVGTNTPWLNNLSLIPLPDGSGTQIPSAGSFHPNQAGQQEFASSSTNAWPASSAADPGTAQCPPPPRGRALSMAAGSGPGPGQLGRHLVGFGHAEPRVDLQELPQEHGAVLASPAAQVVPAEAARGGGLVVGLF